MRSRLNCGLARNRAARARCAAHHRGCHTEAGVTWGATDRLTNFRVIWSIYLSQKAQSPQVAGEKSQDDHSSRSESRHQDPKQATTGVLRRSTAADSSVVNGE